MFAHVPSTMSHAIGDFSTSRTAVVSRLDGLEDLVSAPLDGPLPTTAPPHQEGLRVGDSGTSPRSSDGSWLARRAVLSDSQAVSKDGVPRSRIGKRLGLPSWPRPAGGG